MNAHGHRATGLVVGASLIASGLLATANAVAAGSAKGDYFDATRFALVEALGPVQAQLRKQYPGEFGAFGIDDAGTPHVAIVGDGGGIVATLKGADLPAATVIHSAVHSERGLNLAMDAISAAVGARRELGDGNLDFEGASISSIELSIQSNTIVFHDSASTAAPAGDHRQGFRASCRLRSFPD